MPIIKSATKKMKQDRRRYAQNLRTKRSLRDAVKAFETKPTFDTFREAQSNIDTAVKKHVLTKQAAARRLSHLAKFAKDNGVKVAKIAKKTTSTSAKPAAKSTVKSSVKTAKPVAKKAVSAKSVKKTVAKKPATKK